MHEFPSLREIIVNLLTDEYGNFIEDIDWVAPRPSTFRVVLKNGESFYLTYTGKSYIAQIEGKKYYLLNLGEDEKSSRSNSQITKKW